MAVLNSKLTRFYKLVWNTVSLKKCILGQFHETSENSWKIAEDAENEPMNDLPKILASLEAIIGQNVQKSSHNTATGL